MERLEIMMQSANLWCVHFGVSFKCPSVRMCCLETLPNRIIPDVAFGNETDKPFMMVLLGLGALSVKVKQ